MCISLKGLSIFAVSVLLDRTKVAIIPILGWYGNSRSDSNRIENRARFISLNKHKELCVPCREQRIDSK